MVPIKIQLVSQKTSPMLILALEKEKISKGLNTAQLVIRKASIAKVRLQSI